MCLPLGLSRFIHGLPRFGELGLCAEAAQRFMDGFDGANHA